MDLIQAFNGQTCLLQNQSFWHVHQGNVWWYALPKTTGLFHVPPFKCCQCFPVGGSSWLSVSTLFHPCCCSCCPCGRPSFVLFCSCFFFLLPISSGYISPLQCWLSTHSMSLWICSIGFHIALVSIGVLGFSLLFTGSLVLFPDSAQEPTWFSVVLLLGRTDGGCSVCPWS